MSVGSWMPGTSGAVEPGVAGRCRGMFSPGRAVGAPRAPGGACHGSATRGCPRVTTGRGVWHSGVAALTVGALPRCRPRRVRCEPFAPAPAVRTPGRTHGADLNSAARERSSGPAGEKTRRRHGPPQAVAPPSLYGGAARSAAVPDAGHRAAAGAERGLEESCPPGWPGGTSGGRAGRTGRGAGTAASGEKPVGVAAGRPRVVRTAPAPYPYGVISAAGFRPPVRPPVSRRRAGGGRHAAR